VLTVGAVNPIVVGYAGTNSVVMSAFSSFGPTDDGRIKPDVVADGVNVFSTTAVTNNSYTNMSGTSMATPSVAGSLGLLIELHNRLYGTNQPMWASTLKGLAIHTTDEAGDAAGPNYRFGWGLLNARRAALRITNNFYSPSLDFIKEVRLTSGDYIEFPVVASGGGTLKVTACWTDPAGTPPANSLDPTNRMLVNDLDLRAIRGTTTNFPWRLNRNSPANAATTGDNNRDNVEQVVITNAAAGTYLVRVTHKGNLVNDLGAVADQPVSLLISGIVEQPAPSLAITSIAMLSSNVVAMKWNSVVGRVYRVQHRDDVASGSWSNDTGEISATKTNVSVALTFPSGLTNRFYRIKLIR
jgi:subtilisin family serine protease